MDSALEKNQKLGRAVFEAFLKANAGFRETPPRQQWAIMQEWPSQAQIVAVAQMATMKPDMMPLAEQLVMEPTLLNLLRVFERIDPEEAAYLAKLWVKLEKEYTDEQQPAANGYVA